MVLGVSGSIAAYRAADLARELMRRGMVVRTCLTDHAQRFVSPALFEGLTGQPCLQDVFEEPERGRMAHIDWAKAADVMVIAPATANVLTQLAHGYAPDMLTTLAVAYSGPLVLAPAMNPGMYASEPVQEALRILQSRAATIVEPVSGEVACGDEGQGKFADVLTIATAVESVLVSAKRLAGQHVLITSGPTQEPIDAVRYLSNRSSGRMGAALARAALLLGAEVTVVTGPTSVPLPTQARVVPVRTAQEMLDAALAVAPRADWIIGAAAVADYRVAHPATGKIRRSDTPIQLDLVPNPDLLATLTRHARPGARVIGFAAEAEDGIEAVRAKLQRKGLTAIAANDIRRSDTGFESLTNELRLLTADGRDLSSGLRDKLACARWLFEALLGPGSETPAR